MKNKNNGKVEKDPKVEVPEPNDDTFEIGDKQMQQLIFDLTKTLYWQAIVKYLTERRSIAEMTLFSLDPFKQPTETARAQGIRTGLWDLVDCADQIIKSRSEENKEDSGL